MSHTLLTGTKNSVYDTSWKYNSSIAD